jgi:peptidyl-prolyl cis-trans isomerase SurA
MRVGEIAGPLESTDPRTGRTFYKLLYLESLIPLHQANLREDYAFLMEMALDQKRMKILNEWVEKQKTRTYIKINESYRNCDFSAEGW